MKFCIQASYTGIRYPSPFPYAAECVLISPDEYVRLMDELNDARLLAVASERMAHFDPTSLISEEEMNRRLGVTEDDLAGFDEVEIE